MCIICLKECFTQNTLVSKGQSVGIVNFLEQLVLTQVPSNLLTLTGQSVLLSLTTSEVIDILKAGVLLNSGQSLALVIGNVLHQNFSEVISTFHLLLEF